MFDIQIRKGIDPILDFVAGGLHRRGVHPDVVTWSGFALGLSGSAAVAFGCFSAGFALIALNRVADGLDGCVARHRGASDAGGFLDIALDMIFYASVPFAFAIVSAANALPAAFLLFSFFGTGSSFLAFAVISAKRGTTSDHAGKKSFFYSTGLIEGAETAVFLLVICLVPNHFPLLAWTFGALCWLTTLIRIIVSVRAFR